MMLASSHILVATHLLTLVKGYTLCSGDSGAWVIDDVTNEVYGHVVADDVFGRGYIVPIHDSLEDMKSQLNADSIRLPSTSDFSMFKAPPIPIDLARTFDESLRALNVTSKPEPAFFALQQALKRRLATFETCEEIGHTLLSQEDASGLRQRHAETETRIEGRISLDKDVLSEDSGYASMATSPEKSPQGCPRPVRLTASKMPSEDSLAYAGAWVFSEGTQTSTKPVPKPTVDSPSIKNSESSMSATKKRQSLREYLTRFPLLRRVFHAKDLITKYTQRKEDPNLPLVSMEGSEEDEGWA